MKNCFIICFFGVLIASAAALGSRMRVGEPYYHSTGYSYSSSFNSANPGGAIGTVHSSAYDSDRPGHGVAASTGAVYGTPNMFAPWTGNKYARFYHY